MSEQKIISFAEETPIDLAKTIEKYANDYKYEIKQISAYCNSERYYPERAIVIFEKK